MRAPRHLIPLLLLLGASFALISGCGYTLRQSQNPVFKKYGVHRVFIAPLVNNSFKPGIENVMYNEVVKAIASRGQVKVVDREELADAVLSGAIGDAVYSRSASTTADQLFPTGSIAPGLERPSANIEVATEYSAYLSTSFSLKLRDAKPGEKSVLWTGSFSRSQPFPGNNQLGSFGTTGHLINDSEFDRALRELSHSLSENLQESMFSMF